MEIVIVLVVVVLLLAGTILFVRSRDVDEPPASSDPRVVSNLNLGEEPRPIVAADEDAVRPDRAGHDPDGPDPDGPAQVEAEPAARPSFRDRLSKARGLLADYVSSVLASSKIDDELYDELEEALIRADVGVAAATDVLAAVRERVSARGDADPAVVIEELKAELKTRIGGHDRSLSRHAPDDATPVWLFVGVNGVGKTTTIGKLGKREAGEGRKVMMAAGDTFRAAASEQLEMWAERVGADIVRGDEGADPASVVFDAVQKAHAGGADIVLADTAGRLHTKVNLMEELAKVRRVAERPPGAVAEVLLVIDATTGQNGLVQAQQFAEAVDVTGVVLTKLDGSAKGGIVLAIQTELGIPVKLVGLGESAEDLVDFDPDEFVDALFE